MATAKTLALLALVGCTARVDMPSPPSDAAADVSSEWCVVPVAECVDRLRGLGAGYRCFDAGTLTFVYFTCDTDGGLHVIGRMP